MGHGADSALNIKVNDQDKVLGINQVKGSCAGM